MSDNSQVASTPSSIPAIRTPLDLQEAHEEAGYAIRALGALIRTAHLALFDPGECATGTLANHIAQDLQFGLSKLIDICIENQARIVNNYAAQYQDSDECLLRKVESILSHIKKNWLRSEEVKPSLIKALAITTIVVQRGDMLAGYAKELEDSINGLLKEKQPANGGKKQPIPIADNRGDEVAL